MCSLIRWTRTCLGRITSGWLYHCAGARAAAASCASGAARESTGLAILSLVGLREQLLMINRGDKTLQHGRLTRCALVKPPLRKQVVQYVAHHTTHTQPSPSISITEAAVFQCFQLDIFTKCECSAGDCPADRVSRCASMVCHTPGLHSRCWCRLLSCIQALLGRPAAKAPLIPHRSYCGLP
jgi:hypothetical protein